MPSLPKPNLNLNLGRRGGGLVGLDIQPGYVAAVQAHVNGGITVQRAIGAPLPPDAIREGEVLDERTLGEALRELFGTNALGRRVRVGLANQRTVLRTLELPPITDRKQLAAAVRSQAEDQVPMPLANAVLDFHSLGNFDTDNGPRQRVIVVAAQREMVERLLRAVRHAGLRPEGVDLSAFALIRSLYRPLAGAQSEAPARVLYLNVGGLTNMAIAEGTVCRFTRVVGGGLEAMATEIAERRGVPLVEARTLLAAAQLRPAAAAPVAPALVPAVPAAPSVATPIFRDTVRPEAAGDSRGAAIDHGGDDAIERDAAAIEHDAAAIEHDDPGFDVQAVQLASVGPDADAEPDTGTETDVDFHQGFGTPPEPAVVETWALAQDPSGIEPAAIEPAASEHDEPVAAEPAGYAAFEHQEPAASLSASLASPSAEPAAPVVAAAPEVGHQLPATIDPEIRMVLENGIREIAGEVRNSLDFHRSQEGGGEVSSVVLSGPALEIAGFAEALEADLGMVVERQAVAAAAPDAFASVSEHRLAIATGLAAEEVSR